MVKQNKGFTLIELLIIIGIIGFLAAAILVAVDPVRRIQEARDSRRWSEVNSILNAYLNKQVDDKEYYLGYFTDPLGGTWEMGEVKTYTAQVPELPACSTYNGNQVACEALGCTYVDPTCSGTPTPVPQVIVRDVTGIDCTGVAPLTTKPVCTATGVLNSYSATSCIADLHDLAPDYISALPLDPHGADWDVAPGVATNTLVGPSNTGYYVARSAAGRITIGSCYPERPGVVINVSR